MKIYSKAVMFFVMLIAVITVSGGSVYAQGQRNDTLYFCEEYKDATEIGNSELFYIGKDGGTLTVMLRTKKPIGVKEVDIVLEKTISGMRNKISSEPFDVDAGWDYIFFAGIFFPEPGKYKVSAVKKSGDVIASGYVMIMPNKY
jgi:hypothetical protein